MGETGEDTLRTMSIRIMTAAWDLNLGSHTAKLVLLALADNANDAGVCWPSIETVAAKCDLTPNGVRKQMKNLVELGALRIDPSKGRKSNTYTVTPNAVKGSPEAPTPNAVHPTPNGVQSVTDTTPNGVGPNRKEEEPSGTSAAGAAAPQDGKPDDAKPKSDPRHQQFIEAWHNHYPEHFDRPYTVKGGKDGKVLKQFLGEVSPAVTVEELIEIAKAAWRRRDLFNCGKAAELSQFCLWFNAICAELKDAKALPKSPGRAEQKAGPEEFK